MEARSLLSKSLFEIWAKASRKSFDFHIFETCNSPTDYLDLKDQVLLWSNLVLLSSIGCSISRLFTAASLIGNYTSRNGVFSVPRRDKARRRVIGPGAFSFALADYLH